MNISKGNNCMNFDCPQCGSDNTQKLSVIYHSGTSSGTKVTIGSALAITDYGIAPIIGSSNSNYSQQTQLAKIVAPLQYKVPTRTSKATAVGGIILIFVLALSIIISILSDSGDWRTKKIAESADEKDRITAKLRSGGNLTAEEIQQTGGFNQKIEVTEVERSAQTNEKKRRVLSLFAVIFILLSSIACVYYLIIFQVKPMAKKEQNIINETNEKNKNLMAEWEKKYFCHKCGIIFIPCNGR
jgi:predicted RNA-binding Zn-ribbon protein involved in translation (DUF1610 family)